jgi:hypothetical protein
VYAASILFFSFALGIVLSRDPESHTFSTSALLLMFIYYGFGLWRIANRYALVNGAGFNGEKDQFDKWLQILNSHDGPSVVEFSTGTFSTGYWTYRMLNPGTFWIVAKFKRDSKRLATCRVHKLTELAFARLPSGSWQIDITTKEGKKSFVGIAITTPLPIGLDQVARQVNV